MIYMYIQDAWVQSSYMSITILYNRSCCNCVSLGIAQHISFISENTHTRALTLRTYCNAVGWTVPPWSGSRAPRWLNSLTREGQNLQGILNLHEENWSNAWNMVKYQAGKRISGHLAKEKAHETPEKAKSAQQCNDALLASCLRLLVLKRLTLCVETDREALGACAVLPVRLFASDM